MRIGLLSPSMPPFTDPEAAKTLARLADTHGVDSLWVPEHVVLPENYTTRYPYSDDGRMPVAADWPYPDPLAWLSFVAGVTSSVRLVTGMLVLPQRNPVVLAKETATIDHLSGGRLELGLGLGWFREEFAAVGVDFADRAARFEEYVGVLRALWSGDETFSGAYHSFAAARCYPKPAGSIPLIMGGHSVAAARRAGRLADGFFPAVGDPVPLFEECRAAAAEAGRDPSSIDLIAEASPVTPERVEQLRAIGVTRVLVYPPQVPLDELPDAFEAFAADFLRQVRDL
ncbi:TIGR03619 family F420-dependent LLM class oxidoreductase [Allokutzneria sp. A3M-2-11 16]|uniref:TIGR03619 family F420-dependent LLM class oxidoreductase n=1 Tax=Allokutzneria sp. A3M-2-11 16 TaxID=2962043 RepID=UPI0020B6CA84|nr:TIGR03619 family F420-dependent LLM class oxidoreductase [Allokutzneria sp. A3M-2-11 16]MCP3803617.1 TIGR03619 family F420-dependent LLM class oxidoreductase [Allokutzneria sp. A3M-2-11 16]